MIDLSIIIVSYNTRELLRNCLLSIFQNIPKDFDTEVIVVDNNSSDGSSNFVKKEFPKVVLIENEKNLGFSKANNIGVRHSQGRYVLFLNPDTIVYPKTLEILVNFMDRYQNAGVATCKILMPNGKIDEACHRGFPTPWRAFSYFSGLSKLFPRSRLFSGYTLGWKNFEKIHKIDACAGAFMMVRRKAGEEIGWWDENYFWYGEDLDFCYRLKEKRWEIHFIPTVSILHYKGVSSGIKNNSRDLTTADRETRRRATMARFEAMRIFYKKHYQKLYPRILTKLVYCGISLKEWLAT